MRIGRAGGRAGANGTGAAGRAALRHADAPSLRGEIACAGVNVIGLAAKAPTGQAVYAGRGAGVAG